MEETKVDPLYMENLEEWVMEENKIVTYKFLSRSLKVHVNVAKQMLFNFIEEKRKSSKELAVVHLVSGLVKGEKGTTTKVVLVKEGPSLENLLSKMDTLLSRHIYSVQQAESPVTLTSLYATDLEVFKEDPISGGSNLSAIKNRAAVPREDLRSKTVAPVKEEKKIEVKKEVVKKEVKKSGIEEAFAKAKKTSPVKAEVKEEKYKSVSTQKSNSNSKNKKPQGQIANFFAKQASKPKVEKSNVESKIEEKENIANEKIEDNSVAKEEVVDRDEEKIPTVALADRNGDKPSKVKSPKKSKRVDDDSKKRKRIQVMSDSEDSAGEDSEQEMEKEENYEPPEEEVPPQSKLLESDDEECIPATPKENIVRPGRRRVRKQVDKTYVDEQGYMVTKKVYESGSETDDEPEPVTKEAKKSPEPKVEAPAAKKAKLAAPGAKAQPGIMNFFKKK